jgi:DNA-binding response OmpR family regulator
MTQPLSLLLVDPDPEGLETLTYGFEREGASVNATSDLTAAPKLVDAAAPSLVVVALRAKELGGLEVIRRLRTGGHAIPHVALLALGPAEQQAAARSAGASSFLTVPTFIRDVVSASKLAMVGRRAPGQDAPLTQARLSDYGGVFYLLRAMAATDGSAVLRLERGNRRAELRVSEGRLLSANVESLQSLPALHHVLLWEEAALSLGVGAVPKRSQLNLSAQEVLDESERFLRDFAHAARDLGPSSTLYVHGTGAPAAIPGLQASQVAPLMRLADGHRVLADVIAESPFRIFDTLRILKRLRDSGTLVARAPEPAPAHPAANAATKNGAPRSMMGEWAMVPDLRGVVGNRRGPNRQSRPMAVATGPATPPPLVDKATPLPLVNKATPLPLVNKATPLPLVNKKGTAAGEIVPRRRPTPAPTDLAVAPTIQVKVDADGVPLTPPLAMAPAVAPLGAARAPGQKTPIQLRTKTDLAARARLDHTPLPQLTPQPTPQPTPMVGKRSDTGPQPRLDRTPPPRLEKRSETGPQARLEKSPTGPHPRVERTPAPRLTPKPAHTVATTFDDLEADFFAREADLYKREALETFDDLDHPLGKPAGKPRPRKK